MITILSVLRSGGVYDPSWVRALTNGVNANLSIPHRHVCLTDMDVQVQGVEVVALNYGWRGWWSKVEMFSPEMERFGQMLYIDLDTLVTGNLDDIAGYGGEACITKDFNFGCPSQSVLNFAPGSMRHLWDAFVSDPDTWMADGDRLIAPHFGDQVLMTKVHGERHIDFWQDYVPGQVVSYKRHCGRGLPDNARLICCHGRPKPPDITEPWFADRWNQCAT